MSSRTHACGALRIHAHSRTGTSTHALTQARAIKQAAASTPLPPLPIPPSYPSLAMWGACEYARTGTHARARARAPPRFPSNSRVLRGSLARPASRSLRAAGSRARRSGCG
eukprot:5149256-Pleurochrysis_carterae.AAC.2